MSHNPAPHIPRNVETDVDSLKLPRFVLFKELKFSSLDPSSGRGLRMTYFAAPLHFRPKDVLRIPRHAVGVGACDVARGTQGAIAIEQQDERVVSSENASCRSAVNLLQERQRKWGSAFCSLWWSMIDDESHDIFYYIDAFAPSKSTAIVFTRDVALVSQSSRAFRELLKSRGVDFSTPLDPTIKDQDGADQEAEAELKMYKDGAAASLSRHKCDSQPRPRTTKHLMRLGLCCGVMVRATSQASTRRF